MSNKLFKSLEVCIEQFGRENVLKMIDGMSKEQFFDSLFQEKPKKSNEMSQKMRKVVEARWAKKKESTSTNTKVDTTACEENANKISVSYVNDTRDSYENSIQKVDTETVYEEPVQESNTNSSFTEPVQKEDTKEEYIEPTSVHTEQDLMNVAESVVTKPVVQTFLPNASYSELQSQFSKLEAAAEEVMATNDPFVIKAFRVKVDNWYKNAGTGAVELIGDVNFLTQRLMIKLTEIAEKEKNNG